MAQALTPIDKKTHSDKQDSPTPPATVPRRRQSAIQVQTLSKCESTPDRTPRTQPMLFHSPAPNFFCRSRPTGFSEAFLVFPEQSPATPAQTTACQLLAPRKTHSRPLSCVCVAHV